MLYPPQINYEKTRTILPFHINHTACFMLIHIGVSPREHMLCNLRLRNHLRWQKLANVL